MFVLYGSDFFFALILLLLLLPPYLIDSVQRGTGKKTGEEEASERLLPLLPLLLLPSPLSYILAV